VITAAGFVLLPYYMYPNLFNIIKNLMKFETNIEIRKEALRLMGSIGALDPQLFKKIQKRKKMTPAIELVTADFNGNLHF